MPYNLRARKNRRFKPDPPSDSDDTSDTDYMVQDSEDEEMVVKSRWSGKPTQKIKGKPKNKTKQNVK